MQRFRFALGFGLMVLPFVVSANTPGIDFTLLPDQKRTVRIAMTARPLGTLRVKTSEPADIRVLTFLVETRPVRVRKNAPTTKDELLFTLRNRTTGQTIRINPKGEPTSVSDTTYAQIYTMEDAIMYDGEEWDIRVASSLDKRSPQQVRITLCKIGERNMLASGTCVFAGENVDSWAESLETGETIPFFPRNIEVGRWQTIR